MAYVTSAQDPDQQDQQVVGNPVRVGTTSGSQVLTPESNSPSQTTQARTPSSSGQFQNLQQYLAANQSGAQSVAGRVAGDINQQTQKSQSAIDQAAQGFGNQVESAKVGLNNDLINAAKAAPTQYTSNTDLQKMLSGAYAGPSQWAGSAEQQAVDNAAYDAQQKAQLGTTQGGRSQLIQSTAPNPLTRGGSNLDQWLVQGVQPALSTVQNAVAGAAPVQQRVKDVGTGMGAAITAAQQNNQQTAQQGKSAFQQALDSLSQGLQGKVTTQQQQDTAQNDALRAFLSANGAAPAATPGRMTIPEAGMVRSGDGLAPATNGIANPALLQALGMTQEQYNNLVAQNQQAVKAGQSGVNLASYLTPGNDAQLGIGNVATPQDVDNARALAQLGGTNFSPWSSGTVTGPSFDYATALRDIVAQLGLPANTMAPNPANTPTGGAGGVSGEGSGSGAGGDGGSGAGGSAGTGTAGGIGGVGIGADGVAVGNTTGISNAAAAAIGAAVSGITGVPGLSAAAVAANNAVNNAANAAAASVNAANADTNADANGTVGDTAAATAGATGTGGAAAAAASAAASAATAAGMSDAAAAAAGQAAADAAVNGADADSAAAAGAAAAAAADGATSGDAADGTGDSAGDSSGSSGDGTGSGDGGGGSGEKDGGLITGPGTSRSDSIPTHLSTGEYVLPAHVVNALGKQFFDDLLQAFSK